MGIGLVSDRILKVIKDNKINYVRVYRERRKELGFIDGYSFKLYGCGTEPHVIYDLLFQAGISGVFVTRGYSYQGTNSIVITYG